MKTRGIENALEHIGRAASGAAFGCSEMTGVASGVSPRCSARIQTEMLERRKCRARLSTQFGKTTLNQGDMKRVAPFIYSIEYRYIVLYELIRRPILRWRDLTS